MLLGHGQADYVLNHLLTAGRIARADVRLALDEMGREIKVLEQRLAALRSAAVSSGSAAIAARRGPGRPLARPDAEGTAPTRPAKRRRRQGPVSPETQASRVLQGQYLGLIHQIPATRRGKYKAIALKQGRAAAISEMRGALKKQAGWCSTTLACDSRW